MGLATSGRSACRNLLCSPAACSWRSWAAAAQLGTIRSWPSGRLTLVCSASFSSQSRARPRQTWNNEDWSGARQVTAPAPARVPWNPEEAMALVDSMYRPGSRDQPVLRLVLGGQKVDVVPMWVAIQSLPGQQMQVYKAVQALSDASAPGMAAAGSMRDFGSCAPARLLPADRQNGHWHNYMVGVESQVGTTSMDSMWPNRVLHGARTAYDLRDVHDVVRFLSQPDRDDVLRHLWNLQRKQEDGCHRPGWCHQKLVQRYGAEAIRNLGLVSSACDFDSLHSPSIAPASSS